LTALPLVGTLWLVRTYGEQLKALRKALGLPQETIADRMGYQRQGNLSLYENDKKRPSVKTVLRHARAYGQKPSEFLRDVIVTEYDRIRAGEYDDDLKEIKPPKLGEAPAPTPKRRRAG
jgi:transcriptional regulator with XRE-family HTH domain